MTDEEQKKAVQDCYKAADIYIALAQFYSTPEAKKLPRPYIGLWSAKNHTANITVSGYEFPDAPYDERGEYKVKKDESIARIANVAKALKGRRDKVMDDDGMRISTTIKVNHENIDDFSEVKLTWEVNKEVTCTKKVTGKTWVEPRTIEGHYEEEYEWECDEVVLLATPSE